MANDVASAMIAVTGISKWFGDFRALSDVNLRVGAAEKVVICGPSGSGKSTLIRCIFRKKKNAQFMPRSLKTFQSLAALLIRHLAHFGVGRGICEKRFKIGNVFFNRSDILNSGDDRIEFREFARERDKTFRIGAAVQAIRHERVTGENGIEFLRVEAHWTEQSKVSK